MNVYHKIKTVWLRDLNTNFKKLINNGWAKPEFEYLKNNIWTGTEKIDGTNIRIIWNGNNVEFKGKTDNAIIPNHLIEKLSTIFTIEKMEEVFQQKRNSNGNLQNQIVCMYGEGYGHKIQNGGNYLQNDVNFILFDIKIGNWWLLRDSLENIANKLNIPIVPIVFSGTLLEAIEMTKNGFTSTIAQNKEYIAEGLVLKPKGIELYNRKGERIITKIKHKDF